MQSIRPSNLSLAKKGLILLAIPFLFELGIVATLWTMLDAADERAKNISDSREVIVKLSRLSALLMRSSESMMMYSFLGRQSDFDEHINNRPEMYEILEKLDRLFTETGREKAMLNSLKRSTDAINETLQAQEKGAGSTLERLRQCNTLRRELQERSPQFKKAVEQITNLEKVRESKNIARNAAGRSLIQTLLIGAFCLSVTIAGFLSWFFYKNIVSRIRLLEEMSRQLGEGKPVPPPTSGKDEIALLHRAIHRASEDLAQAAKEKQKVAVMLSHDLRSPLMSIQGNLALVLKGLYGKLNEDGIARLNIAETSLERLISMITQFLQTEKLNQSPLNLENTRLGIIFDRAVQMLSGTADNARIVCRATDLALTADVDLMVRVLTNLIGNAVKFTPPGGCIIVAGARTETGVEIQVSDEGPGIPEDLQGTIFEPYIQTPDGKKVPKSSGLGLSICKEIVNQHGGTIGVSSNRGPGVTFSIELPIVQ